MSERKIERRIPLHSRVSIDAESEGVVSKEFLGVVGDVIKGLGEESSTKKKRLSRKDRYKHFKAICIAMYSEDLERLDAMVKLLKDGGMKGVNRSSLIRSALASFNMGDFSEDGSGSKLWVAKSIKNFKDALDSAPIEAGKCHPAENVLKKHIRKFKEKGIMEAVLDEVESGKRGGDMVTILGRMKGLSVGLRSELVDLALESEDVAVRYAIIGAIENWGEPMLVEDLEKLRSHKEPVDWLAKHIELILRDLEELKPVVVSAGYENGA